MLAIVGVDGLHGLLIRLQALQLGLQLFHGQRVVGADPAHAGGAYLVQQARDLYVLAHIAVTGGVLLVLFPHREIGAPGGQDRGHTGIYGILLVEVFRQLAGVAVKQPVDLVMVHGINAALLSLPQLIGRIHHSPVLRRGGAGFIVIKAVHNLGLPRRCLVDGVIADRGGAPVDIEILHLGLGQRPRVQAVQKLPAFCKGANIERVAGGQFAVFPLLVGLQKIGVVRPVCARVRVHFVDLASVGLHDRPPLLKK